MRKWRNAALSSGKRLCLSAILASAAFPLLSFLAVFEFFVVIVKKVTIVSNSCCIENCNSNSDHRSERKLDKILVFFTFIKVLCVFLKDLILFV